MCVIRANVFTEVPGLRGMGIRVGTDSTPLQPGGKTAKGPARKLLMPSWQAPPAMEQVPWNTCVSWMAIGSLWAPVNQASITFAEASEISGTSGLRIQNPGICSEVIKDMTLVVQMCY